MFPPGPLNAITDVAGVKVGHTTIIEGDSVRTGVTAVLPHGGAALEATDEAVYNSLFGDQRRRAAAERLKRFRSIGCRRS